MNQEPKPKLEKITIDTKKPEGNAWAIMCAVIDILEQIHGKEEAKPIIEEYTNEAVSSDYEHLKATSIKYLNQHIPELLTFK